MKNEQINDQSPTERALQALILDPDLEHLEDLLAGFNLFDVLGIAQAELRHSAVLAWLLDPRGSHGLGDYFLRRFLTEAAKEGREHEITNITPFHVDGWKLSDIEVATERHNIDVLLVDDSDGLVCLIENKIAADEQPGQLSRYLATVKNRYPELIPFPIFLTPDRRVPEDETDAEGWVPFGYETVVSLIARTLETRGSTISTSVSSFLTQYADTLRRHVVNTKDNIDELAYRIYNNHRAAIDLIINAKPGPQAMWDAIEAVMKEYTCHLKPDFSGGNFLRFYAPALDELPDLKEGQGWTKSRRLLLFEFKCRERVLDLVMGPGPEKTRTTLYNLAQNHGVPMRRSRRLAEKWHHIYRKSDLLRGTPLSLDREEAKLQLKPAIDEFFEKDYWPLVNAIRKEFGLASDATHTK